MPAYWQRRGRVPRVQVANCGSGTSVIKKHVVLQFNSCWKDDLGHRVVCEPEMRPMRTHRAKFQTSPFLPRVYSFLFVQGIRINIKAGGEMGRFSGVLSVSPERGTNKLVRFSNSLGGCLPSGKHLVLLTALPCPYPTWIEGT